MTRKPYTPGRTFIGKLSMGSDLVASLSRIAQEEEITVGTIALSGVVEAPVLTRREEGSDMDALIRYDGRWEIGAGSGTISQFKGRSMARVGGVLSNGNGDVICGTLAVGSIVHACEVVITEFVGGGALLRDFDPDTGRPSWKGAPLDGM